MSDWFLDGPYNNEPDPHRIYQPDQITDQWGRRNFSDFYPQNNDGLPGFVAPYGAIYPNLTMTNASVPGPVSFGFSYRPFN